MKKYWKYIKPYLSAFIIGPLLMIVEVIGEVLMPKIMANIINNGVPNGDYGYIAGNGALMIGVAVCMLIGGVGGAYFAAKASVSFSSDMRRDLFHKIQEMSFANLDKFSTGSLVTRLTNDITQVQNLINMILRMMLRAPGMLIGGIIMAVIINPKLALILVVVMPILILIMALVIKNTFPKFKGMQSKLDSLNNNISEVLTSIRVIKSFVREDFEMKKFEESNQNLKDAAIKALKVIIVLLPVVSILMNGTTLAVVWFGGNMVINPEIGMPIGDLTAFITYITQILSSLMMVAFIFLQCTRAFASLGRINEVLNDKIDITDDGVAFPEKQVMSGEVEFHNVSFRYYARSEEKVLNNISLKIESGLTLGIIGSTGSGKTTLVSLIPRLYDTDEGEVLVDGVNVRDYSLKNLREGVGMVLQKNVLFSGSVKENLRWGKEDASEEELEEVSRDAYAYSFINDMESGFDSELEQGGVNLSGGQKQRMCIARALLKKPKILILDDSTSAVDTATEAGIRECFKNSLKDTTKIIIAQRISSVIEADRIAVLDDGEIVGVGTHSELMKSCEAYREIYFSQKDKEEEVNA